MPFSTARWSLHRPPGLPFSGNSGEIRSHAASAISAGPTICSSPRCSHLRRDYQPENRAVRHALVPSASRAAVALVGYADFVDILILVVRDAVTERRGRGVLR